MISSVPLVTKLNSLSRGTSIFFPGNYFLMPKLNLGIRKDGLVCLLKTKRDQSVILLKLQNGLNPFIYLFLKIG